MDNSVSEILIPLVLLLLLLLLDDNDLVLVGIVALVMDVPNFFNK